MCGNVLKWCSSKAYPYPYYNAINDREDLEKEYPRVQRGGAFNRSLHLARCANRSSDAPYYRGNTCGFRVVQIISEDIVC